MVYISTNILALEKADKGNESYFLALTMAVLSLQENILHAAKRLIEMHRNNNIHIFPWQRDLNTSETQELIGNS